jgi:hypothetical protein
MQNDIGRSQNSSSFYGEQIRVARPCPNQVHLALSQCALILQEEVPQSTGSGKDSPARTQPSAGGSYIHIDCTWDWEIEIIDRVH